VNLKQRLLDFLAALPGAESLDAPNVLPARYSGDRADFALFGRSLVVEVKSLQRDPTPRVQRIVDEYRGHPRFPPVFGPVPLPQVIAKLARDLQEVDSGACRAPRNYSARAGV